MASSSATAPSRANQVSAAKIGIAAKSPALTFFAFFSIYFIWGSTYLGIRYAVETIPPLYTAGLRHLVAGTILLLSALAKGQRPTAAQLRASLVIGVFFFLIGHGTLHWAETFVPSGLASLLIATEPIWVFLVASAVEK
jgi:drug/metabolite transporter (DMT)-like permease